ncbi:MAG: TonB-dependent receptor [Phenylobacterium sp.]|uniref:TonB-dependent receptor n=1 Tax=Phenylobacterium sp. TaxID=1871053 RepID=UPI001226ABDF|nr:TonB-dependent receptor [Phenylobacterium sp.]TAL28145.1 MAG: TonB-dependent receptor [Phenylobacterium sp.]
MTKGRFFCSASAIAALFALGASGQAHAQAQANPTEIGEVVVTGSFIRGTPEDAALPVDVISQADLEKQGSPSTLELIKTLSVSSGVLGDTNQFDTRAQGSEGSGSINLRGLGAARTLVLLNGRRMPLNPFAAGVVDTNIIPQAAIGRVEILKDGAAATYGSDAIGGVVNFITRSKFDGLDVGGSYTLIDGSKGNWDTSAVWGKSFENGEILISGGWQHRSELKTTDRSWALRPFAENAEGGWSGGTSTTSLFPILQSPTTGRWSLAGGPSVDVGCAAIGNLAVPGGCRFQFTAFDNLIEKEDRYQVFASANFDLNENHRFHTELLWAKTDVPVWKTSPSYLTLQTPTATTSPIVGNIDLPAAVPGQGWFVPATNPGLVAYRTANPTALPGAATGVYMAGVLYRPLSGGGNNIFPGSDGSSVGLRSYEAYRVSGGFSGETGFMGIGYDVALTYGQEVARRTGYDTVASRLQLAMRGYGSLAGDAGGGCTAAETNNFTTGAGNAALGCLWFNPFSNAVAGAAITGAANPGFNPTVANNPDLIRWLFPQVATKQTTRLVVFDAVLNGKTGIELAGGDVAWAAGVQARRDTFDSQYSPFTNIGENPCIDTPVNGSTNCAVRNGPLVFLGTGEEQELERLVYAGFGELAVPITDSLQLQFAIRYEDYERVGSTTNYKATARFQATDWLALRGSIGTTFRGPTLTNLTNSSGTALSFIAGSFRAIDTFGNPDLDPETANTYSAGLVFDVGNLKATLDYWRFDFKDPIVVEPSGSIVNTMFPGGSTARCGTAEFAQLQQRFTFQGACSTANISRVRVQVVNGPKIKTSGIDLLANYDFGEVAGGDVRMGVSATYTLEYKINAFQVAGVQVEAAYDAAGFLNYQLSATSLPEWKGSAFLEYERENHNLRFTLNYIDSYTDQRTAPFTANNIVTGAPVTKGKTIKSTLIAELDYRVELPWDTTVTASIDNLFDRDPSFARLDLNYDPFTGNAMGRTFKVAVRKRF